VFSDEVHVHSKFSEWRLMYRHRDLLMFGCACFTSHSAEWYRIFWYTSRGTCGVSVGTCWTKGWKWNAAKPR